MWIKRNLCFSSFAEYNKRDYLCLENGTLPIASLNTKVAFSHAYEVEDSFDSGGSALFKFERIKKYKTDSILIKIYRCFT